jgi:nuclear pore complex protein Nup155
MAFPQTPARNVPGAFFETPAHLRFSTGPDPARRRLFGDSQATQAGRNALGPDNSVIGGQAPATSTTSIPASTSGGDGGLTPLGRLSTPSESISPIARAAKAINQFLQADENYPDLDSYCRRK